MTSVICVIMRTALKDVRGSALCSLTARVIDARAALVILAFVCLDDKVAKAQEEEKREELLFFLCILQCF